MTREVLQRLYDRYQAHGFYGHLTALVTALGTFLDQPDPTVEIAYLKAKLADVEAERDQLKKRASDLLWQVTPDRMGK